MPEPVYVYAEDPDGDVHLVTQDDLGFKGEATRTLCGYYGTADLIFGDETVSGLVANCQNCLAAMIHKVVDNA